MCFAESKLMMASRVCFLTSSEPISHWLATFLLGLCFVFKEKGAGDKGQDYRALLRQ